MLLRHCISWPRRYHQNIHPLFLPWLGCKSRCIFCAQEIQTGVRSPVRHEDARRLLDACYCDLAANKSSKTPQLAFYGGTFTALPEDIWKECLTFARRLRSEKLITGFRCSTRPDCLKPKRLQELKAAGCNLVELGIQSFSDQALALSGRGYNCADALAACRYLREYDMGPGIQLLPGLPGLTSAAFLEDVSLALNQSAVCLRFYPCLVLAGSKLAEIWRKGVYTPWSLEQTLSVLAKAWLMAANAGVPVIRMGLAPQPDLAKAILAGPVHEALGSRVIGQALLLAVSTVLKKISAHGQIELDLPAWLQGCFWGWKKELASSWQELGLQEIRYWQKTMVQITYNE